jgi:predicted transcriptional regulator
MNKTKTPTIAEVDHALEQIKALLELTQPDQHGTLTALYADVYAIKLRVMAKENPHASH